MSNAAAVPTQEPQTNGFLRAVIIAQGLLTLFLAFGVFPPGVVAMLMNAVLAFASRGTNRRLFAGFVVTAGIIMAAMALFLLPVSSMPWSTSSPG